KRFIKSSSINERLIDIVPLASKNVHFMLTKIIFSPRK
ncbi:MAG: hypothetical protein ACI9M9_002618, partial [Flavobacteriaceae bacterium]